MIVEYFQRSKFSSIVKFTICELGINVGVTLRGDHFLM
jgi:hypothetical protein